MKPIAGIALLPLLLTACVTINIYFPAAAAEEAARTIVRDVMGKEGSAPETAPAPETTESPRSEAPAVTHPLAALVGRTLTVLVQPAHAQGNIDIRTPAINTLRASMTQRRSQLNPYFNSGAIGLTNDALVAVRDSAAIPLRDRNTVNKLVADENKDRNALYREIARANGHPEWEKNIRDTFARIWVEEAPSGQWYQDSAGTWKRK